MNRHLSIFFKVTRMGILVFFLTIIRSQNFEMWYSIDFTFLQIICFFHCYDILFEIYCSWQTLLFRFYRLFSIKFCGHYLRFFCVIIVFIITLSPIVIIIVISLIITVIIVTVLIIIIIVIITEINTTDILYCVLFDK